MITGADIQAAREAFGWTQSKLATKARVPLGVVMRAESSPGEPVITTTHRNLLLSALRAGGAAIEPLPSGTGGDEEPRA